MPPVEPIASEHTTFPLQSGATARRPSIGEGVEQTHSEDRIVTRSSGRDPEHWLISIPELRASPLLDDLRELPHNLQARIGYAYGRSERLHRRGLLLRVINTGRKPRPREISIRALHGRSFVLDCAWAMGRTLDLPTMPERYAALCMLHELAKNEPNCGDATFKAAIQQSFHDPEPACVERVFKAFPGSANKALSEGNIDYVFGLFHDDTLRKHYRPMFHGLNFRALLENSPEIRRRLLTVFDRLSNGDERPAALKVLTLLATPGASGYSDELFGAWALNIPNPHQRDWALFNTITSDARPRMSGFEPRLFLESIKLHAGLAAHLHSHNHQVKASCLLRLFAKLRRVAPEETSLAYEAFAPALSTFEDGDLHRYLLQELFISTSTIQFSHAFITLANLVMDLRAEEARCKLLVKMTPYISQNEQAFAHAMLQHAATFQDTRYASDLACAVVAEISRDAAQALEPQILAVAQRMSSEGMHHKTFGMRLKSAPNAAAGPMREAFEREVPLLHDDISRMIAFEGLADALSFDSRPLVSYQNLRHFLSLFRTRDRLRECNEILDRNRPEITQARGPVRCFGEAGSHE